MKVDLPFLLNSSMTKYLLTIINEIGSLERKELRIRPEGGEKQVGR